MVEAEVRPVSFQGSQSCYTVKPHLGEEEGERRGGEERRGEKRKKKREMAQQLRESEA